MLSSGRKARFSRLRAHDGTCPGLDRIHFGPSIGNADLELKPASFVSGGPGWVDMLRASHGIRNLLLVIANQKAYQDAKKTQDSRAMQSECIPLFTMGTLVFACYVS